MVEWYFITHGFVLFWAIMGWIAAFKEREKKMEWKERYKNLHEAQVDEMKRALVTGAASTAMNKLMEPFFGDGGVVEEMDLKEDGDGQD